MSRKPALVAVLGALVLSVFVAAAVRSGSEHTHVHHRDGAIVGSEQPHQIPTEMAFSSMFHLLGSQTDTAHGGERARSYLAYMRRSTANIITADELRVIHDVAVTYNRRRKASVSEETRARARSNPEEPRMAVRAALDHLERSLSPQARAALAAFVEREVKPNMKVLR